MYLRTALQTLVIFGVVAVSSFLLAKIFGDTIPTEEVVLWIVATAIPVVPVALILAALERRKSQDQALLVLVVILGSVFVAVVSMLIVELLG